jgi:DNA-binding GntR family transcriptional regulator
VAEPQDRAFPDPPPALRPARRSTLADDVYEPIKALIMDHKIAPDARVNIDALARQLDVSATPVREALAQLEREGLVRSHPQRGFIVFVPTVADLRQHYEIRIALEELAAAKAAEAFDSRCARPLAALLDEMATGPPAERYLELNQRFHSDLYAQARRAQLLEIITGLRDASRAYLHIYRAAEDFPVALLDAEHRAILTACEDRDPPAAAAATRAHLQRTVDQVTARLEARGDR